MYPSQKFFISLKPVATIIVDLIIIIYSNTHTDQYRERKINTSAGDLEATTVSQRTLALSNPTRLPLYDYHPTPSTPFHAPPVCTLSRKSSTRSARWRGPCRHSLSSGHNDNLSEAWVICLLKGFALEGEPLRCANTWRGWRPLDKSRALVGQFGVNYARHLVSWKHGGGGLCGALGQYRQMRWFHLTQWTLSEGEGRWCGMRRTGWEVGGRTRLGLEYGLAEPRNQRLWAPGNKSLQGCRILQMGL